jgi:hypothetical protein
VTTRDYTSEPLLGLFQISEISFLAEIVKLVQLREQRAISHTIVLKELPSKDLSLEVFLVPQVRK